MAGDIANAITTSNDGTSIVCALFQVDEGHLAVVDTVIYAAAGDVVTGDVGVSQIRLHQPRPPRTRLPPGLRPLFIIII